jgi:hypothetical protein
VPAKLLEHLVTLDETDSAGSDFVHASADLVGPCGIDRGLIDFVEGIEAVDQFAGQSSPILGRQTKRLVT